MRNIWKKHKLIIILSIPALLFVTFFIMIKQEIKAEKHPGLRMISNITDIRFPKGAKLIESKGRMGWGDCSIQAKIEFDGSYIDSFMDSLPFPMVTKNDDWHIGSIKPDWWINPEDKNYKLIRMVFFPENEGGRVWNIFVPTNNPEPSVIYLEYAED